MGNGEASGCVQISARRPRYQQCVSGNRIARRRQRMCSDWENRRRFRQSTRQPAPGAHIAIPVLNLTRRSSTPIRTSGSWSHGQAGTTVDPAARPVTSFIRQPRQFGPPVHDVADVDIPRAEAPFPRYIRFSSRPAGPTKGSPWSSSSAPGASPTNMILASRLPTQHHPSRAGRVLAGGPDGSDRSRRHPSGGFLSRGQLKDRRGRRRAGGRGGRPGRSAWAWPGPARGRRGAARRPFRRTTRP